MIYCKQCGKTYDITEKVWQCSCGSYLSYDSETKFEPEKIDQKDTSMWRYKAFLPPIDKENIVSLGEGWTPIIKESFGDWQVDLKLDYISPSGSFKDRGISVMASLFKQLGIKKLVEDSSGNAGAALATYSAKAGLNCRIYVPAHTSENKLIQIKAMGAEVIPVEGTREDVAKAAVRDTDGFYASHNWSPFFIDGIKTIAFEIWEQEEELPDNIFLPLGYGSIVSGVAQGFLELYESGVIKRLPKIRAAQAVNCCPMHDYYYHGEGYMESRRKSYQSTVAEGIASLNPIRKSDVKELIDKSEGSIELLTEKEIADAMQECAKKGVFIEPTSAVAAAAFLKSCQKGSVKKSDKNMICLTGWGMKDLAAFQNLRSSI